MASDTSNHLLTNIDAETRFAAIGSYSEIYGDYHDTRKIDDTASRRKAADLFHGPVH